MTITLEQVCAGGFIFVGGYCMIRNLILLVKAGIELKKIRRDLDNSYMNLITSIEDRDSIV